MQQTADSLLVVEENQGQLYQDIQDLLVGCREVSFRDVPHDCQDLQPRPRTDRNSRMLDTFAVLRIALNLLKEDQTTKAGIKTNRLRAGWDANYLLKVLSG